MNRKALLSRSLLLVALIGVWIQASPLAAQEPPSEATGPALPASDPLAALNAGFRAAYAGLREKVLAQTDPIIVQFGDRLVLLRHGVRTEAPALSKRYHELKAVAHVPLAVYVLLVSSAGSKLDAAALDRLRQYRGSVVEARGSLEGRGFNPRQRERQLRMMDRSLGFIDTVLRTGMVSKSTLRLFTRNEREDIRANAYEAAEDQILAMDKQMRAWLADMTPQERKRLRVVVGAAHMPRVGNLTMQYFSVALGQPYEGRYEQESVKHNDSRLVYGESRFDEQGALKVLATHFLDADIGVHFFDDPDRMHRDLLADATEEIIRKRFGKRPVRGR
jgi:hypothetical protein